MKVNPKLKFLLASALLTVGGCKVEEAPRAPEAAGWIPQADRAGHYTVDEPSKPKSVVHAAPAVVTGSGALLKGPLTPAQVDSVLLAYRMKSDMDHVVAWHKNDDSKGSFFSPYPPAVLNPSEEMKMDKAEVESFHEYFDESALKMGFKSAQIGKEYVKEMQNFLKIDSTMVAAGNGGQTYKDKVMLEDKVYTKLYYQNVDSSSCPVMFHRGANVVRNHAIAYDRPLPPGKINVTWHDVRTAPIYGYDRDGQLH